MKNVLVERFGYGIRLYRCDRNLLDRPQILNSNQGCIFFSAGVDRTVSNCLFDHAYRWYAIDPNGLRVGNLVTGCIFKDSWQGDLKLYSGSGNNVIRGNIFDGDNRSQLGVVMMNAHDNLIQSNVFMRHRLNTSDCAAVVQRTGGGSYPPAHYNYNNQVINNTFCASGGGADLTGTWTKVTRKGHKISAAFSCQNTGSAGAGSFEISFYFSREASVGLKSRLFKSQSVDALSAGAGVAQMVSGTRARKHKFIIAVVDSLGSVFEADESNNLVARQLP